MSYRGCSVPAAIAALAMLTGDVGSAQAGELWLSTSQPGQVFAADVKIAAGQLHTFNDIHHALPSSVPRATSSE